jgi:hypothetical protein
MRSTRCLQASELIHGANGEGRTPIPLREPDPKSGASANSATFALGQAATRSSYHYWRLRSLSRQASARHCPYRSVRGLLTHTVLNSDVFPRKVNGRSAYALQPAWFAVPGFASSTRSHRWYYAAVQLLPPIRRLAATDGNRVSRFSRVKFPMHAWEPTTPCRDAKAT